MKVFTLLFGTAPIAVAVMAAGQTSSTQRTFEVASIKANNSGSQAVTFMPTAGRFNAQNVTLHMLINRAFNVQDFQVTGGPWMDQF
jgi:hypothetical protein